MNRKLSLTLISISVLFSIGFVVSAWSETPPIQIEIAFEKPEEKPIFLPDERIGFTVTVSYNPVSAENIWISEGFKAQEYYLEARVIDPTGRLLLAQQPPPELLVQQAV